MKAMVFAAGVGSRLRPLTDGRPKALVDIGGVPMLEIVIRRLIRAGVDEMVVNVHHFPEKIEEFLKAKKNFGIRVELSRETELLETGGGLKRVAPFFADGRPFIVHNVDVLCDLDLARLVHAHESGGALATLSVRDRASSRRLLFDEQGCLIGREPGAGGRPLAFDGIHAISPEIFAKFTESGRFSITDSYLRLAAAGEPIRAFRADESYWRDIGGTDKLEAAQQDVRAGRFAVMPG